MALSHSIAQLPVWISFLVLIAVIALVAAAAPLLVRKRVSLEQLELNNEVAGFKYATLGVIYAVLLAFVVVLVWEDFGQAEEATHREADGVAVLYHLSAGFEESLRSEIHLALRAYTEQVIEKEWLAMAAEDPSLFTDSPMTRLYQVYMQIDPQNVREEAVYQASIQALMDLNQTRLERVLAAGSMVPEVLWIVLIVGAVVVIGFTLFFGSRNAWVQATMTGILAVMVMLVLMTAVVLDYPFTGEVSVHPEALERVRILIGS